MPTEIPTNLVGLFILVVMGVLSLLTFLVRRTTTAQERTVEILDNHLGELGKHMSKTNTVLDLMLARLLDVALRKPEDGEEGRR